MALDARTVVKNISGATRFFGYLSRRGVELADNEEYTFVGDIWSLLNDRDRGYLESDLADGNIALVNNPALHVEDSVAGTTKVIDVESGSVVSRNPDYDEEGSSS